MPTVDHHILLAEQDPRQRNALCTALEDWGYRVTTAFNGQDVIEKARQADFGLILASFDLPGPSGIMLLQQLLGQNSKNRIIFLAGEASVEEAVETIKAGALNFVSKPIEQEQLQHMVQSAMAAGGNGHRNGHQEQARAIVTQDPAMLRLLSLVKQVADSAAPVLIQAESGTGKELLARFIHHHSRRQSGPFSAVNCGALPENLLESELFGHEKGAFTGAVRRKPGRFELAQGGTLLLDEITEMQPHLQVKLLRVLQEREVDPVGSLKPIAVDVRIIATTNRELGEAIQKGHLREDLYYRLNVIPLKIPPLRARKQDISLLAEHFIAKYNQIDRRNVKRLTDEALEVLLQRSYQGNVRELENIIERAVLLCDGEAIRVQDLYLDEIVTSGDQAVPAPMALSGDLVGQPLKEVEKKLIVNTLDHTDGNRTHAAQMLGISVRTLRNKLNEYKAELQ